MQCTMPAAAAIRVHCALATWRIWMWSVICSNCSTTVPLEPQCFPDFGAGLDGTKWGLHSDQIEAGSLTEAKRGPLLRPSNRQIHQSLGPETTQHMAFDRPRR
jgi:hypothetical protein